MFTFFFLDNLRYRFLTEEAIMFFNPVKNCQNTWKFMLETEETGLS